MPRIPRRTFVLLVALAGAFPALAQAHVHKPRHGGVVREAGGFVYELVARPDEIVVFVTDESDKPVATQGSSAELTLIDSGTRTRVPLAPAGDNRLAATGAFKVKPGMSALLEVGVGGKTVARLRYTLK